MRPSNGLVVQASVGKQRDGEGWWTGASGLRQRLLWMYASRLRANVHSWRLVEISRSRQNTHVARVAMRRVTRRLRMGDDIGAGQLHVGLMIF